MNVMYAKELNAHLAAEAARLHHVAAVVVAIDEPAPVPVPAHLRGAEIAEKPRRAFSTGALSSEWEQNLAALIARLAQDGRLYDSGGQRRSMRSAAMHAGVTGYGGRR